MTFLGQWNGSVPEYADGWVLDNHAYLGHIRRDNGIHIIDITDPANPVQTANFLSSSPGGTCPAGRRNEYADVEVQWQRVNNEWKRIGYFSNDPGCGVVIADVTDPYAPTELFRITSVHGGANNVHTISLDGPYLYEADSRTATIRVFNVSNPANPVKVRDIISTVGDDVHEVTAQNGRLYTAGIWNTYSAEIFDISRIGEPGHPVTFLGLVSGSPLGPWPHTTWPTEDNNYMAVTREYAGGDLSFWDIRNRLRRSWCGASAGLFPTPIASTR